MTALPPTPGYCSTLLQGRFDSLMHLLRPESWDKMTEEQRNNILHLLQLTAETTHKLSEVALVEALTRNATFNPGPGVELRGGGWPVADRNSERPEAATMLEGQKVILERQRLRAEVARVRAEAEKTRDEMVKMAEETEKLKCYMIEIVTETKQIKAQISKIAEETAKLEDDDDD